jgi:hypothetical protein
MSYGKAKWSQHNESIDSGRPSMRSNLSSDMSFTGESQGPSLNEVFMDSMNSKINELQKTNARIKKYLLKYAELDDSTRKKVRQWL